MTCEQGVLFSDSQMCSQICQDTYKCIKKAPLYCCDATQSINFDQYPQFIGLLMLCLGGLQQKQDCTNTCYSPYTCYVPDAQYCCESAQIDNNGTEEEQEENQVEEQPTENIEKDVEKINKIKNIAIGCSVGVFLLISILIVVFAVNINLFRNKKYLPQYLKTVPTFQFQLNKNKIFNQQKLRVAILHFLVYQLFKWFLTINLARWRG
ncbi:Hypothetical_protein [Hexamita inflata]|uniref:Hypothetical_protein n=1 Tax=Hexamita inflata TaxID=28002 RepID=A0ABP1HKM6_9EUKA